MPWEDPIVPVSLAFVPGCIPGFYQVTIRITALFKEKSRAGPGTWKREGAGKIRKNSVNRSRSTFKGRIVEQMAIILPNFYCNPADAQCIGSPVDYIISDYLSRVADDREEDWGGTLTRSPMVDKTGCGKNPLQERPCGLLMTDRSFITRRLPYGAQLHDACE